MIKDFHVTFIHLMAAFYSSKVIQLLIDISFAYTNMRESTDNFNWKNHQVYWQTFSLRLN
jgi:hypothetical protein